MEGIRHDYSVHRPWRRGATLCLLLICAAMCNVQALERSRVVTVVMPPGVAPYAEALEGVRSVLEATAEIRVVSLERKGERQQLPGSFTPSADGLVLALGAEAASAVAALPGDVTVLYTMVLRSDLPAGGERGKLSGMIGLEVPVEAVAARLKQIFPGKLRLGVIVSPHWPVSPARLSARAVQAGLTPRVVECPSPDLLLQSFRSLRSAVDFVWCLPDSSLYNSVTVQALLLASLNERLPIIGFSSSFVRSGALMGVYPNFRDVGVQTAQAIQSYFAGRALPGFQFPRSFDVGVNQRVARLLGLIPKRQGFDRENGALQ